MASILSPDEEAQLVQTIEMFEVIIQSQPYDYQSLEILKEAYSKLGREEEVVSTSKRIAQAYVQMGQFSSAILEYETILQRHAGDPDALAALKEIESKANSSPLDHHLEPGGLAHKSGDTDRLLKSLGGQISLVDVEDGRRAMYKLFVESKIITGDDFSLCWPDPDLTSPPSRVIEPFIQVLADKGIVPVDKSLKLLADKSRFAFLPLSWYETDMDLTRSFPAHICRRWCVMPFDRMSKSILVATANPFNQQAAKELAAVTPNRLLWYLVPPAELLKNLQKAFR